MGTPEYTLCRAEFLLPLAEPDRGERIQDGYVLAEGETLKEVGRYTPATGRRIREACGSALRIIGDPPAGEDVPRLRAVLMPAFV